MKLLVLNISVFSRPFKIMFLQHLFFCFFSILLFCFPSSPSGMRDDRKKMALMVRRLIFVHSQLSLGQILATPLQLPLT